MFVVDCFGTFLCCFVDVLMT